MFAFIPMLAFAVPVDELLIRVGRTEQARVENLHCRYIEKSMIEELDKHGKMKGRQTHVFVVEQDGMSRLRVRKSESAEGEKLNAQMRPRETKDLSKEEKAREEVKLPIHPREQSNYRFAIDGSQKVGDSTHVALTYEPVKPVAERMKGTFVVDEATGHLVTMDGTPSEMPTFLNAMTLHVEFADTPCGTMARQFEISGEGGILFIKTRFHAVSTFSEQTKR